MAMILETQGLTKVYGSKTAVQEVNMHIPEGQIYGLIGRNGAGKTTIMRIISGLSTPTSGSYSLFGETGSQLGKRLKDVGVLIEYPGIYPKFSGFENLKIKAIGLGVYSKAYVESLLEAVGLGNVERKTSAGNYSLGMRQRLGIALALVGDPKLLVLDEPINGLDPQGIAEVRGTLERLRDEKGITIMISSHILDELAKVADSFGIINEGRLLEEFSSAELHRRSGRSVVIRAGDLPAAQRVLEGLGLRGSLENDGTLRLREGLDRTAEMAAAIVQAGIPLQEIYLKTATLEEYYLSMTGGGQHA